MSEGGQGSFKFGTVGELQREQIVIATDTVVRKTG